MGIIKAYSRMGETFENDCGSTLTIVGVIKNDVGRGYKHLVECSICSIDKELFPKPFPILYAKLKDGRSPCACTRYVYDETQVKILIKRRCKTLDHKFLGFKNDFISVKETIPLIDCGHKILSTYSCHHYINYILYGCDECSSKGISEKYVRHNNYPENIVTTKSKFVKGLNQRVHFYQCEYCSNDWFVQNNFCDGWFKFAPNRLDKGLLSCRCNHKYFGDNLYRKGKATKAQLHHNNIEVLDVEEDIVTLECSIHGLYHQDYSSCCEGRIPKCCSPSSWGVLKGRENEIDNLHIISLTYEDENYIKIGRAFDIRVRQNEIDRFYRTNLLGFISDKHENIVKYEKFYHKIFMRYNVKPSIVFAGEGELFSLDVLKDEDFKLLLDKFIFDY